MVAQPPVRVRQGLKSRAAADASIYHRIYPRHGQPPSRFDLRRADLVVGVGLDDHRPWGGKRTGLIEQSRGEFYGFRIVLGGEEYQRRNPFQPLDFVRQPSEVITNEADCPFRVQEGKRRTECRLR